jgi:hypothetical protein
MTNDELDFVLTAIEKTIYNSKIWVKDYVYSNKTNEYYPIPEKCKNTMNVPGWFEITEQKPRKISA